MQTDNIVLRDILLRLTGKKKRQPATCQRKQNIMLLYNTVQSEYFPRKWKLKVQSYLPGEYPD